MEEGRILSEIGILFVEGFETTGHTISWTLLNIASSPGEWTVHYILVQGGGGGHTISRTHCLILHY